MCECMSMNPGATTSPSQSIVSPENSIPPGEMSSIVSPFISRFPLNPGLPVPSAMNPFLSRILFPLSFTVVFISSVVFLTVFPLAYARTPNNRLKNPEAAKEAAIAEEIEILCGTACQSIPLFIAYLC